MIVAVLDTNVLVQGVISSAGSASSQCVERCFDGKYRLAFTSETIDELVSVLKLPKMVELHGFSEEEIVDYVAALPGTR